MTRIARTSTHFATPIRLETEDHAIVLHARAESIGADLVVIHAAAELPVGTRTFIRFTDNGTTADVEGTVVGQKSVTDGASLYLISVSASNSGFAAVLEDRLNRSAPPTTPPRPTCATGRRTLRVAA